MLLRSLLSFSLSEEQTSQSQPIIGTPPLVPVPKKVILRSGYATFQSYKIIYREWFVEQNFKRNRALFFNSCTFDYYFVIKFLRIMSKQIIVNGHTGNNIHKCIYSPFRN